MYTQTNDKEGKRKALTQKALQIDLKTAGTIILKRKIGTKLCCNHLCS